MAATVTPDHSRNAGVLITVPVSHFCEKARWALDHAGLRYREHGYPPLVHKLAVRSRGSRTAPLLVGRQTLRESTDILRFADTECPPGGDTLYPAASGARREMEVLVTRLDLTLGPQVRRWFYSWALADERRLYEWASCGLSPHQRGLLRILLTMITTVIADRLEITERSTAQARKTSTRSFNSSPRCWPTGAATSAGTASARPI